MQLAGELAKMNLASLIRLVRNGELTGKICITQGENSAYIYFESGTPTHVEADFATGRDALLELFLWHSGTFSYSECSVGNVPCSLSADEPLERLLREGLAYQDAVKSLEQKGINAGTVFKATAVSKGDPLLSKMDGKTPLAVIVQSVDLSRSIYILHLNQLVVSGKAVVVEPPETGEKIQLPDWVISRLKQDNPDVSQSIVQLVIWADRIKCWLYQADVDLQRVINALDTSEPVNNSTQDLENLNAEFFHPQESMMEQEIASNLNTYDTPSSQQSSAPISEPDKPAAAPSSAPVDPATRGKPSPPSYEF